MSLYVEVLEGFGYNWQEGEKCSNIFVGRGSILKVEVVSLQLFAFRFSDTERFVFDRTHFDFFVERGVIRLLSRKELRDLKREMNKYAATATDAFLEVIGLYNYSVFPK